jgi:hypothetical protein
LEEKEKVEVEVEVENRVEERTLRSGRKRKHEWIMDFWKEIPQKKKKNKSTVAQCFSGGVGR